ncbi:MAG: spore coat protein U domain-containing protein [Acidobacteria bacterium]|nr:spore coat protein U domain-containing protein [Acidobacteriota bacterium]
MKVLIGALVLLCGMAASHVEAACTVSTGGIGFGSYDVFSGSPVDSTGIISFSCDKKSDITITLNTGGSGTFSPRRMSGPDSLDYNLYLDAARSTIWGDGTSGTGTYSQTNVPKNTTLTVTVYGRVPNGQDVSAGSYGDSVTVTILF